MTDQPRPTTGPRSEPRFMAGPPIGWQPIVRDAMPPRCLCGSWEWHWTPAWGRDAMDCVTYQAWIRGMGRLPEKEASDAK